MNDCYFPPFQFLALFFVSSCLVLANGSPIHTDDVFQDTNELEIHPNEIIRISAIVNGVRMEEIPSLLSLIAKVRSEIKGQVFDTLEAEVARFAMTEEEISQMIDALVVSRVTCRRSIV